MIRSIALSAALLASFGTQAMDINIGGMPIEELEKQGLAENIDGSWKVTLPNGSLLTLKSGSAHLQARLDELQSARKLPSEAAEGSAMSQEIALLQEALLREKGGKYQSAYTCYGTLTFDPSFYIGSVGGSVTSYMSFTEFGPYAPYQKNLHVFAEAWDKQDRANTYRLATATSGWFGGQMREDVSATAGVYMTFFPFLRAWGYMTSQSPANCPTYYFMSETRTI